MAAEPETLVVQYSAAELAALRSLLGDAAAEDEYAYSAQLSADARDVALNVAASALVARGVVRSAGEGEFEILPPHTVLLEVLTEPGLVVLAEHARRDGGERRLYLVRPDIGVEHSVVERDIHRLTAFEAGGLVERVTTFLELEEVGAPAELDECVLTDEQLEALRGAVENDVSAVDLPAEAEPLAAALQSFASSSRLVSMYRDGTVLRGGDLRWLSTADGLWLLEPATPDASGGTPVSTRVRRIGAEWLLDRFLEYLPGEAAQPAAT
jgi:hypothetical protein